MMHGDRESDNARASMASIPVSIAGFGSFHSLVSAVTLDDDTSTSAGDEGSLSGFLPRTASRDWRFGSRNNLSTLKSRDSVGKFATTHSSSNLHNSRSRFYPQHSPTPDGSSSLSLKARLTSQKVPSTLPLPMPTRKMSSNQMGLNIPTRKASLYNMTSPGNKHNATFENLNTPARTNAKFDLIVDKLSTGTKSSLFPQVHKTSALKLNDRSVSAPTPASSASRSALGLSNDIFVVLSPANSVPRPKISQANKDGIKRILGMVPKDDSHHHAVPSIPQRKPSGPNLF